MEDMTTLCLLGIFVLVGFALMSRMLGRMGGGSRTNYPQRGPYNPTVDDPNIQSGGSMGSPARPSSSGGFPGRQGGGLFPSSGSSQSSESGSLFPSSGSSQSSESGGFPGRNRSGLFPPQESSSNRPSSSSSSSSNRPNNDDPNIESRGGFGRPKK